MSLGQVEGFSPLNPYKMGNLMGPLQYCAITPQDGCTDAYPWQTRILLCCINAKRCSLECICLRSQYPRLHQMSLSRFLLTSGRQMRLLCSRFFTLHHSTIPNTQHHAALKWTAYSAPTRAFGFPRGVYPQPVTILPIEKGTILELLGFTQEQNIPL
ncbi:unnamed protein product [Protopolystoma xenopodis]|uniref:Uncharacterized protein n=1 Tax=Protopolystoma xenopodis TaxID=117903 RepID=A0A3S5A705_9PLAT|nr:unnamed protein product [Protopolystoma xenopodis]